MIQGQQSKTESHAEGQENSIHVPGKMKDRTRDRKDGWERMKKGIHKMLVLVLSMAMIIGMTALQFPMTARAEDMMVVSFTLKISVAEGTSAPESYGVDYRVVDDKGTPVSRPEGVNGNEYSGRLDGKTDGTQASKEVTLQIASDSASGYYIEIKVQSAGKDIWVDGKNVTDEWSGGKKMVSELNGKTYDFQLKDKEQQNPNPSEGGSSSGGESGSEDGNGAGENNPPSGTEKEVNLTVTWSGEFGDIQVGGVRIASNELNNNSKTFNKVSCQNDKIKIHIAAPYPDTYTSIKINGNEKLNSGETKASYDFDISQRDTELNIVVVKAASNRHTIVWGYDNSIEGDALVQHGKVEMVSGCVEGSDGHYLVNDGAEVTIKLIPDYGYQVVGAKINGEFDLTAASGTNEFKFTMPSTNVHFKGIFKKTADIVNGSAAGVTRASLTNGSAVASTGGTAKMTINTTGASDTSSVNNVDISKKVQAVDIQMSQLFYKNSADSYWETKQTELTTAAEVKLVVDQDAAGYAVLRAHGDKVEEIPASYDAATKTVTFASDKYSVFTLVPLTKSNNQYTPIEEKTQPSEDPGASREKESSSGHTILKEHSGTPDNTIQVLEQKEISRNPELILIDTTGVDKTGAEVMPKKTYNLSSFVTVKGFMNSIDRIAKAAQKDQPVSIYSERPVCFSKEILKSMTKHNLEFVYYFKYKGHLYCVTIPPQTDLDTSFKEKTYFGPLYLGHVLGTSKLVK